MVVQTIVFRENKLSLFRRAIALKVETHNGGVE